MHRLFLSLLLAFGAGFTAQAQRQIPRPAAARQTTAEVNPADAPYLFSYHDDSTARLIVATSQDGVAFTDLPTSFTPPPGDGVRDPSILRYRGVWYVVYTAGNFGGVPYFGVAKSSDLRAWTWICNVATQPVGGIATWAPEFFLDTNGKVYVFAHVAQNNGSFHVIAFQPTQPDLSAWDAGIPVTTDVGGTLSYIDAQVTGPIDGYYYMIVRPYGQPGAANPLNILRSTSLLTGWSIYKNGDFGNWRTPHNVAEAGNLLDYGNGHWRIYSYPETGYGTYPYSYSESFDGMTTWTPWVPVTGTTYAVHGTVLKHSAPIFTNGAPPPGTVGKPYRFVFTADGRPAPALSLTTAGALPPGLAFDAATGVLAGTPTAAGVYAGIGLSAGNGVPADAQRSFTLTVNDTFANFAAAAGLTGPAAGPLADPDGDGLCNLLEYALNFRPATAEASAATPLDTRLRSYAGVSYLAARFTRVPLATDLTYVVESSSDLAHWTPVATSMGGAAFSGPGLVGDDAGNSSPHTVEIRDTIPMASAEPSARFLRLRVSKN